MGRRVLGIDACRRGWVGIELRDGRFADADADSSLAMLIDRHPEVAVIAVDMPIDLPGREARDCDVQAKHRLGARARSVLFVPPIAVLEEDSYEKANDLSRELTGRGVTQQAYALRAGVKEVGHLRGQTSA